MALVVSKGQMWSSGIGPSVSAISHSSVQSTSRFDCVCAKGTAVKIDWLFKTPYSLTGSISILC